MSKTLTDKIVLVTGAARGVGAATARRLAAEGADVAITYTSRPDAAAKVKDEIEAHGTRALVVRADQSDPNQAASAVHQVFDHFGRLDVLVNNAGLFVTGELTDPNRDEEKLAKQWAVNVHGLVATVRAAAPLITDGGRIISIATGGASATHTMFKGFADYFATKSAIVAYTKGWAREFGPRGITVNVVQPGPIDTDMNPATGAWAETQLAASALGRFGRPEDIAAAVAYLASPDANYVTASALTVDGGLNAT